MKTNVLRMAFVLLLIGIIFQLTAQVTITGRVTGNDAPDGIGGAGISLVAEENNYNVESAENGNFTIQNVIGSAEGIEYQLTITYEGYAPHRSPRLIVVQAGPPPPPINWGVIRLDEYSWQPYDLIAIEDDEEGVVDLMWEAPMIPEEITEMWLHYDDGENTGDVGSGAGTPMQYAVAIRYTPAQLVELNLIGLYITTVRFFPFPIDPADPPVIHTVQVHTGGSIEGAAYNPGFLAASQRPENVIPGQWNEVVLNNPVLLQPGQEVWIGYHLNSPTGRGAGYSATERVDDYGDLIQWGVNWTSINRLAPAIAANWNIQAYTGFHRGDRSFTLGKPAPVNMTQPTLENSFNHDNISEPTAVTFDYNSASNDVRTRRIADRNSRPVTQRRLEGYHVFRYAIVDANDPEAWAQLAENIERTAHRDTTWDQLPVDNYRYAVQAVYTGGVLSPFAHSNALATSMQGDGTAENPYRIGSASALDMVRNYVGAEHLGVHFLQTNDINLNVAPWNEGLGWVPIGGTNDATAFQGVYDGGGHVISGMRSTSTASTRGLFSRAVNATFKNLGLEDIYMTGGHYIGGLVGWMANNTRIENVYVTGEVNATGQYTGGLVGYMTGAANVMFDCYSTATIKSSSIQPSNYMGGLIGFMGGGEVRRIYATGLVLATVVPSIQSGAVVGRRGSGTISELYWNIDTCGQTVGAQNHPSPGHTTSQLLRRDTYQGFNFPDNWLIEEGRSYAFLSFQGDEPAEHNFPPLLPPLNLIGVGGDGVINLSWTAPNEEMGIPDGYNIYKNGVLLNDDLLEAVQYQDTEVENWVSYHYEVTAVYDGEESMPCVGVRVVPVLFAGGTGALDDPFQIEDATQLSGVRFVANMNFILISDIDLGVPPWNQGTGWVPMGATSADGFSGTLNGDNHVIRGLTINTNAGYQGLFGYLNRGTVSNLVFEDVNIQAGAFAGALVGRIDGVSIVRNVSSHGVIRGANNVGGLTGYQNGTMEDSHSTATVTGTGNYAGGIIGASWGTINRCWASGDVTGVDIVGGLSGEGTNGTRRELYATGRVEGRNQVGGLFGFVRTSAYHDCFAMGDVVGNDMVGGLMGNYDLPTNATQQLFRGYSIGRVTGNSNVGGLTGRERADMQGPFDSYWNTETSGQAESAGGEPRDGRHMIFPYQQGTYVNWNFDTIWRHDIDPSYNGGYPRLHFQTPNILFPPEVAVELAIIDEVQHILVTWEPVDGAQSYKVFASANPSAADWGDPVAHVGEDVTQYSEAIVAGEKKFFRVVASSRGN